jgi:hypothetical protein
VRSRLFTPPSKLDAAANAGVGSSVHLVVSEHAASIKAGEAIPTKRSLPSRTVEKSDAFVAMVMR